MIFTSKISLFRFHKFKEHDMLVIRERGAIAMCYMNGPFKDTRLVDVRQSRILPPQIGHNKHTDFSDWVEYETLPSYIPEYQWFMYYIPGGQQFKWYLLKWEKYKNGDG